MNSPDELYCEKQFNRLMGYKEIEQVLKNIDLEFDDTTEISEGRLIMKIMKKPLKKISTENLTTSLFLQQNLSAYSVEAM